MKILETTLRDGSYTINYQFNLTETRFIAKALDEIGFEYIEIGPGVGFNAGSSSKIAPAVTDEQYIKAARPVVKNGKIGMFFIPGIGRRDDIQMAAHNGLDFIRVGTNIDEFKQGFEYLELCAKNKIETAANLMKSYAVSPKEFGRIANECHKAGADTIYLVDSAGGMLPDDVRHCIEEAKSINPSANIGFHGHDNLGLAIANTLAAIEAGAEIVDSSIRGMGRSSGNTITEKLLLVMKRQGKEVSYDLDKLFELSEKVILPYLSDKPETTLDLIYGYSQFHSSFLGTIKKYADKYSVAPKDLIVAYTKIDKLDVDEDKLDKISKQIAKSPKPEIHYSLEDKKWASTDQNEQLLKIGQELFELKQKYNLNTFFNISKVYSGKETKISPIVHIGNGIGFGSAELADIKNFEWIDELIRSKIDGYLLDDRFELEPTILKGNDTIFLYNDAALYANAITNYINIVNTEKLKIDTVFIRERTEILAFLKSNLENLNISVVQDGRDADLLVLGDGFLGHKGLKEFPKLKWIILSQAGLLDPFISENMKSINLIRIGLEYEIIIEIIKSKNYRKLIRDRYGILEKEGQFFCSGGYVGPKGTVVVDDIHNIKSHYGLSKGDGRISYYKENRLE